MEAFSSATWRDAVVAALGNHATPTWTIASEGPWTCAWSLDVGRERHFVKIARAAFTPMLEAEADGLRALASTGTITVPRVRLCGTQEEVAFLVLSWLEFGDGNRGAELGRALAAMHRRSAPCGPNRLRYGWYRDNYIGGTPQQNGWSDDWAAFFRDRRLAPQLARATRSGHASLAASGSKLLEAVPLLLDGHDPEPSLLHGDLWSGNAGSLTGGSPVVFDPAVYVGDRETDLAMTGLFGGFDRTFYDAYQGAWPLPPGHEQRRDLYKLYHVLNHLNLFGDSYLSHCERLIDRLLAQ
jgi:fructosamine-3-kinase